MAYISRDPSPDPNSIVNWWTREIPHATGVAPSARETSCTSTGRRRTRVEPTSTKACFAVSRVTTRITSELQTKEKS